MRDARGRVESRIFMSMDSRASLTMGKTLSESRRVFRVTMRYLRPCAVLLNCRSKPTMQSSRPRGTDFLFLV